MENLSQQDQNTLESRTELNSSDHSFSDHSVDSDLECLTQREAANTTETNSSVQDCTKSTIFVKDSEDEESSDEKIFEKSVTAKKHKKSGNSNANSDNQQSTSSAIEVPSVSAKRTYDTMKSERDEEEQNCPICLEMWSSEGGHRLCSLKCGHLFGKSCIFNWLVKQKKNCCPQCNKKASSFDIRELFATKLIALDCSEKIRLEHEIEIVREEKRQVEIELAKCRLYAESFKLELNKLQMELAKFTGKIEDNAIKKGIKFHLEKTLQISDGSCRVCAYNSFRQMLLVCHQSKNQLFPGFGIKKIQNIGRDYVGNNFLHLHSKAIRDIRFHPLMPNIILTVGFDKFAKLCDLEKQSITQSFSSDYALWSCCWDEEDPNFFYAGTGKGTVHVFDVRSPGEPVAELKLFGDTSPVVSICYVPGKSPQFPHGGIICCRLNSVVFYKKENGNEFTSFRFNNLVGPFFSLILDPATGHVLVSCRPSTALPNVRHLYCELDGEQCQPVHVFGGGTVQSMLSRPCFVKLDKETLIAVFQESTSSIELWSTATGQRVSGFRVREEIFDVASMSIGERIFVVAIASSAVRFYEAS